MFCRHAFGNISGGFRGISCFFGNFAGFRGNFPVQNHWIPVHKTMISRVFCNHTVNLKTDSKTLYCLVPEYVHTLPREDSFICTPDLPGFSISGGLWLSKFKIRNLTYQNRYCPSSCFLDVFRNCIINKRINVCIWQIVKLWVSQSYCVMTSRWLFHYNPVSCDTN